MLSIEIFCTLNSSGEEQKIGDLDYERIKGSASYRFRINESFLSGFPHLKVSADIGPFPGIQAKGSDIFLFLGDALPDRWGKALIDKRERILAKQQGRLIRHFDDFGYLVRVDDATRMGALRFKHNGEYVNGSAGNMNVPPLADLGEFIRMSHLFEESERSGKEYSSRWLDNVWKQGSSLGGARPKGNIRKNGELWIAKIPSINDAYDVALWENFACRQAGRVRINVASTELVKAGNSPFHTLLSKRFDRDGEKRIHYASSITLAGLRDGDGAGTGKGYLDLSDTIVGDAGVANPSLNLEELYRRVVFNIIIGNHDDHFRNHGFVLTDKGWTLSPAFDINPTNLTTQSLLISPYTNDSSIRELLDAAEYYLIPKYVAKDIVGDVCDLMSDWKEFAAYCGIKDNELSRFSDRIHSSLIEAATLFRPAISDIKPVGKNKLSKGPALKPSI